MNSMFFKKLVAMITALLISWGIITLPAAPEKPDGGIKSDCVITFNDSDPGCAGGTVSVTSNYDGEYSVFWGTQAGEKLTAENADGKEIPYSRFAKINVENGKGSETLSEFLAIPDGAQTVLLYFENELLDKDAVPAEKINAYDGKIYSFGALSDVHFGRYFDGTKDKSDTSFPRALNFLDGLGVSMVGMSGDLSFAGETSSFKKVGKYSAQHDFPVFTCRGNHDCGNKLNTKMWQKYLNKGVYGKDKREGVLAVADNGYDFVFRGEESHGDVFIFFSQISGVYAPGVRLVTDKQLDWLEEQFETYKNERVYLFFHTFFNAPDGNPNMGEGNLVNDFGESYSLPYRTGNKDEKRFRSLLTEYKNVTFFNGHSHFAYDMQSYNARLNITSYEGTTATMVHVSSCAAPRTTGPLQPKLKSNAGTMSEGLFITVYPSYIIITACDFVGGQFLAYATYRINNR